MFKKKTYIYFGLFTVLITLVVFHISRQLPYYYQSRVYYLLNDKEMQDLAIEFLSDSNISKFSVGCDKGGVNCRLIVHDENGEYIEEDEVSESIAQKYIELVLKSNLNMGSKRDGHLFFNIGSMLKFGKNFSIAYIYYPNGSYKYKVCDESDYKDSVIGHCEVHLSKRWSLYYFWVDLENYKGNGVIPGEQ